MTKTAKDMVTEAKSRVENLDPTQVAQEQERGAVIVDLRDGPEIKENGKIPGSVHIPRGMLEFRADTTSPYHDASLNPDRRIILHCASGGRSALGAMTLQEMGYTHVAHLDGGFKSWVEQDQPIEQG
ncbi:rhodanese-like domain-containing protein [Enteractinococcus fodinae]|uniref:Rhodanese-related sulfurtransferase n=1 Tax=Enteractinococcus fodinae TaxID=684663 RepID=A0ABU2B3S9_9MICC|nr:rhodanese-like domain-containing protein [Enteractinococcus fodinae]MDR7348272.1 rhodanese-related sulfurtransferase [Enteractinococcus fodinae]